MRRGKGDRARVVGLDNGAPRLLGEWVERRRSLGFDDRKAYLFCSVKKQGGGGPIATSYLRRLLPKLADRVRIAKRVHPHMLRHTRAAELAGEGVPVKRDSVGFGAHELGDDFDVPGAHRAGTGDRPDALRRLEVTETV